MRDLYSPSPRSRWFQHCAAARQEPGSDVAVLVVEICGVVYRVRLHMISFEIYADEVRVNISVMGFARHHRQR
jgi:hypothetical protein